MGFSCVSSLRVIAALMMLAMTSTGCSIERWRAYHECKAQQAQAKSEALRAEAEALRCERLQESEALQSQYEETLKTQLGLPVGQKIVLGQMQVDEEKLTELLDERKKQKEALKKFYDEYEAKRQEKLQEALKVQLAEALEYNNPEAARDAINSCCRPKPPSCAATEGLTYQPVVPEALTEPLLPTEIPFMLPITVKMEMGQALIGPTHVERLRTAPEPLKEGCCQTQCCPDSCTTTDGCTNHSMRSNTRYSSEPFQVPPLTSSVFDNVFK